MKYRVEAKETPLLKNSQTNSLPGYYRREKPAEEVEDSTNEDLLSGRQEKERKGKGKEGRKGGAFGR